MYTCVHTDKRSNQYVQVNLSSKVRLRVFLVLVVSILPNSCISARAYAKALPNFACIILAISHVELILVLCLVHSTSSNA